MKTIHKHHYRKKLAQLGKYLGILALIACAIIFIVGILSGINVLEIFMTAVSLAVSAIPEGLPAIVTIVLAIGVQPVSYTHLDVYKRQGHNIHS